MRMVRMYTGDDGRSHFEDLPLPAAPAAGEVAELRLLPVSHAVLRRGTRSAGRFQTAPLRQYVITLAGRIEIEVGDGSTRELGPGDILLAEDTEGEGHRVRALGPEVRVALSLPIEGAGGVR
jgi:uncharacterized cupin superfamily protein